MWTSQWKSALSLGHYLYWINGHCGMWLYGILADGVCLSKLSTHVQESQGGRRVGLSHQDYRRPTCRVWAFHSPDLVFVLVCKGQFSHQSIQWGLHWIWCCQLINLDSSGQRTTDKGRSYRNLTYSVYHEELRSVLPGGGKEKYVWPSGYLLRSFGASMLH